MTTPADEGILAAKLDDILRDAQKKPPMIIEISATDLIEYDQFQYVAEASSLGLKPGEWPDVVICDLPGSPWRAYTYLETMTYGKDGMWKSYVAKSGFVIRIDND